MQIASSAPPAVMTREQVATKHLAYFRQVGTTSKDEFVAMSGPAITPALSADRSAYEAARTSLDKVQPFRGSLDDAIGAARELVRASHGGDGWGAKHTGHHAHAVIAAGSDAWWLTALDNSWAPRSLLNVDEWKYAFRAPAPEARGALQAIVGADETIRVR